MSRLSPIVFAQQAQQFLNAAEREQAGAKMQMSLPAYFLAGRAIELALKSYMLLKGENEQSLRRVSHDLAKALDEATRLGLSSVLPIEPESDEAVRWINNYYSIKDLEYPTTGYKSYPPIHYLIDFCNSLLKALEGGLRAWRPPA